MLSQCRNSFYFHAFPFFDPTSNPFIIEHFLELLGPFLLLELRLVLLPPSKSQYFGLLGRVETCADIETSCSAAWRFHAIDAASSPSLNLLDGVARREGLSISTRARTLHQRALEIFFFALPVVLADGVLVDSFLPQVFFI